MTNSVLITGTSSGLGLETALYLAQHGLRVYATMRDLSRRATLDREAVRRNVHLQVLQLDVTDPASIQAVVTTVIEQSKGIYGLVSNAGINIGGYFEDLSEEEIRQVFEVNIFGTMAVTRVVLPYMRAARRGRIVIMSSIGGKIASPSATPYCASKFALEGFGESLAQEVRPFGVHVTLLEPGSVKTELYGGNRRVAARALDPQGPYYEWFQQLQGLMDQLARTPATSAKEVAKAVHQALIAKRPRLRYVVGRRTKLLITLRRYLPGELFERIWTREAVRRVTEPKLSSEGLV
jgi:NAD(P)-dependent dehydrogenase (short-subunit alcohol dehydrogenase family)